MRIRIQFLKWKTGSDQVEFEDQVYFKCIYTILIDFSQT